MRTFVYRFGYCTPAQWAANEAHGWDDESSSAFLVQAQSVEEALAWGDKVANAFVAWLFARDGKVPPTSWSEAEYASWIEEEPAAVFSPESLQELPVVACGQMPDFTRWK